MCDGFRIEIDQLRDHTMSVEDFASRADTAAGAAQQVAAMDDAYGVLCRHIAWILAGPQKRCADSLDSAAHALRRIVNDLNSTADTYVRIDVNAAGRFAEIGRHR